MTKFLPSFRWFHVALLALLTVSGFLMFSNRASAWQLDRGYFTGRTDFQAYNYCSDGNTWVHHVVICGGLTNSSSKDVFISRIRDRLQNGSASDKVGASAIVYLMLGYSNGNGRSVPVSTSGSAYKDWEARVLNPEVELHVDNNYYYELNSSLVSMDPDNDEFDLIFYEPGAGTYPTLVFEVDGDEVFAIKLKCANPVGDSLDKLPPPQPPDRLPTFNLNVSCDRIRITNLTDPDRPRSRVWVEITPGGSAVEDDNPHFYGNEEIEITDFRQFLTKKTVTVTAFSIDANGNQVSGAKTTMTREIGPCPNTISCVGLALPTVVPNDTITINPQVRLAYWSSPPYSASVPRTPEFRVTITPPSGSGLPAQTFTPGYAKSPSTLNTTLTANGITYQPTVSGSYAVNWQVTTAHNSSVASVTRNCSATFVAGTQPYFKVTGGDVLGGFDPTTSIIASWNKNNSPAGNYFGAGTTHAAIAAGDINSFISSSATNQPSRLSFANTSYIPSSSIYGGGFLASPTRPDYYNNVSGGICPTSIINLASLVSGVYNCIGNVTINGGVIGAGKNITIKTTGNVFIAGNINYIYSNLNLIPRLSIITSGGNIVVSSSVTELRGMFVAQKNGGGAGGNFYSCGSSANNGYNYTSNNASCLNNKLTVSGSVVVDGEIILGRTKGSISGADTSPAEEFIYSPEFWLSKPLNTGNANNKYDSYISLPPLL